MGVGAVVSAVGNCTPARLSNARNATCSLSMESFGLAAGIACPLMLTDGAVTQVPPPSPARPAALPSPPVTPTPPPSAEHALTS